jgi:hypothetical protein
MYKYSFILFLFTLTFILSSFSFAQSENKFAIGVSGELMGGGS